MKTQKMIDRQQYYIDRAKRKPIKKTAFRKSIEGATKMIDKGYSENEVIAKFGYTALQGACAQADLKINLNQQ
tara:strand:- start:180 stop:398 length:219 start_codon:yes stop_codon:yes gene_type:complete